MTRSVLRIGVMELRRRPGTQREVQVATPLPGLAITSAQVPEVRTIVVDGILEAIEGGVTFSGTVTAPWTGECRRCLEPVVGTLEVALSEVFEPQPDRWGDLPDRRRRGGPRAGRPRRGAAPAPARSAVPS